MSENLFGHTDLKVNDLQGGEVVFTAKSTARRDIRKLQEMKLIVPNGKLFKLNTGILH